MPIEGGCEVTEPFETSWESLRIGFRRSKDDGPLEIYASVPVPDFKELMPKFGQGSSGVLAITAPENPYYDELMSLLGYIESLGSFWLSIDRLRWNHAERTWLPETEDEKRLLQVSRVKIDTEWPVRLVKIKPGDIAQLLAERSKSEGLVVPLAFLREGTNDYHENRYIFAFLNFYQFLGWMYGGGKTKNYAVVHEFQSSPHMQAAVKEVLERWKDIPGYDRNLKKLDEAVTGRNLELSPDGIIEYLVDVRGDLSHFRPRPSVRRERPLDHDKFRVPAYLAMSVCVLLATALRLGVPLDQEPTFPRIGFE